MVTKPAPVKADISDRRTDSRTETEIIDGADTWTYLGVGAAVVVVVACVLAVVTIWLKRKSG